MSKKLQSPWSLSLQTAIWRREWGKLYALVEAELPAEASERLAHPPAFANPEEARFDLETVLLSWALPDFVAYMEALSTWLGAGVFQEPHSPHPWLLRWPGDLKPPPAEPPALWSELHLRLRQPNPEGFVAAALLQLMATARGVARYRESLPQ
ncbi:hypothetical protein [Meiothermus hypogaeus]|uniref:Uncharacterized protein n=2 Tax=Meiothermus hypogaeus TaxID=884155 RepID=A0A511QY73_9DEIN|nr:hypothetical protein [Meiothermus hypogaeus]RIH77408.1 hypothetical protein Mhypo_02020 [Meiothermus hypogaeus]GEM82350.1 hypothetical protein MHY01S_05160 [Meiothermus hypogaeus NBRC 106114]